MTLRSAAVLTATVLLLAACSNTNPAATTPSPAPSPTPSTAAPAPVPSGERGRDLWQANQTAPWMAHVKSVDAIGKLLIIQTDLTTGDADTALAVCQAGHAYVAGIGAADATVTVYAGRVVLATSRNGAPCRSAL